MKFRMVVIMMAGLAWSARAENATLVGKPLAGLSFDHVVFKAPFRASDIQHRVVLITLFRDGDMATQDALVTVDKLAARHALDERFRACCVLTSLQADATDPPELDETVRQGGRSRSSIVPIMRDSGNRSLLALSTSAPALPFSILAGEDGVVVWTGVLGSPEKAKEIQKAVDAALLDFDARNLEPRSKGMKECERAWNSRDFARSWREVSKVLEKPEFTDTDRDQGRTALDMFNMVADHEVAIANDKRGGGMPREAMKLLERGAKVLKEVPAGEKVEALIKEWRKSKDFLVESGEQNDLDDILEKLSAADCARDQVRENLKAMSRRRADSPVCRRAAELAELVK